MSTLDNYGNRQRLDGCVGQGGVQTIVIDDSFADALPFPFQANIIKEVKTGAGTMDFYMPLPNSLPIGPTTTLMYANGEREITFGKAPGEVGDVQINGDIVPVIFPNTNGKEFFVISCDATEWRIEKLTVSRVVDEVPVFSSDQPYVTFGNNPLTYEYTIPANVINRTTGQDILYIRAMLKHENGTNNDLTTFAWRQPVGVGPLNVLFAGQCASTPAAAWLEIQVSAKGVGGLDTQFCAVDHCATGGVAVMHIETSALDLTQDWELVTFTDDNTILTTVLTISYEAFRVD
jgi:hypothetical protein